MCLAFSSDSRFLASGSADNTIMVWDLLEDRDCTTYVQTRFYLLLFSFVLYIYMYILHWSIYTFHSFEARGRSWRAQCWCALHSAICVGRCILSVSVPTLESARKVFHACWLTSARACVCAQYQHDVMQHHCTTIGQLEGLSGPSPVTGVTSWRLHSHPKTTCSQDRGMAQLGCGPCKSDGRTCPNGYRRGIDRI